MIKSAKMIKCNICESEEKIFQYKYQQYSVYRCGNCVGQYIYPRLNLKLNEYINRRKYETLETEETYINMEKVFYKRAVKCAKELLKYKKKGLLLDIGCGYGYYLKIFKNFGFKSQGIDISNKAISHTRKFFRIKVVKGWFEKYLFKKQKFDLITMVDVLEHFQNPNKVMLKVNHILNNKGIIFIQTPNINSLMSKLTGKYWYWLLVPNHQHIFSLESIKILLSLNKFKILKISTIDDIHELCSNIMYRFGINNFGKTSLLFLILMKITKRLIKPLSYIWNKFYLGGLFLVYAQKE